MAARVFGTRETGEETGEAGLSVKVGLLDRFVRVIIIIAVLMVPPLTILGLWVLAIGANFTALQRIWYVYRNT